MAGKKGMKHTKFKYNKKLASAVIELMERGNTLSQVCKIIEERTGVEGLQPYNILSWRRHYPEFREEYEIAYDSRSALWSDELYSIASSEIPVLENKLELTAEIQRRKFQIDVLKTLLNKHRPTTPARSTASSSSSSVQNKSNSPPEVVINLPKYTD